MEGRAVCGTEVSSQTELVCCKWGGMGCWQVAEVELLHRET